MKQLGFEKLWINKVMMCVKSVTFPSLSKVSLRDQSSLLGDSDKKHYCPHIYILFCIEGFDHLLSKVVERKHLLGIQINRGAPNVNYLFFANESFVLQGNK